MNPNAPRRAFGALRILPSGRHQARYAGPNGQTYKAPMTFDTHTDADEFLAATRTDIVRGNWIDPTLPPPKDALTFREYSADWMRSRPLKPTTHANYQRILDRLLLDEFGDLELTTIDPASVKKWHASQPKNVMTVRAYGLLRTIMAGAVDDSIISVTPVRIAGAGSSRRTIEPKPATPAELDVIVAEMPARLRLMVLLAAWCALRFGELAGLQRDDIDIKARAVTVRRGITRTKGQVHVGTPKSRAGTRTVHWPPHLDDAVKEHLRDHVADLPASALLFPASDDKSYIGESAVYYFFKSARTAASRKDLRFHDLRHTGATYAAEAGATVAELMARLGHSSPSAAMVYQHSTRERDKALAAKMSENLAASK